MIVTYDGSAFFGFQYQPDRPTIQDALERAIGAVIGEKVRIQGSGRTDAGVHAVGQVVAFVTRCPIPLDKLTIAINGILPATVRVRAVTEVESAFHPRFDAVAKHYRYLIREVDEESPFLARFYWQVCETLAPKPMRAGLRQFLGTHDFSAFACSPDRYENPVRTIQAAKLTKQKGNWIIDLVGDGFLHNQVRNMVRALVLIGTGQMEPIEIGELYRNRDRRRLGPPAPPGGLYLMRVMY